LQFGVFIFIDKTTIVNKKVCDFCWNVCSVLPFASNSNLDFSWYSRVCGCYHDFFDRWLLLTRNLLNQGFLVVKLKSSLWTFYGHHHDLVNRCKLSVSRMTDRPWMRKGQDCDYVKRNKSVVIRDTDNLQRLTRSWWWP
jgi:hypothetical protein